MHLYTEDDSNTLIELLLAELPATILGIVSEAPSGSLSRGEIRRIVGGSLPSTVDHVLLDMHIDSVLRWFVRNGDIDSADNSRYVRVPPYALRQTTSNQVGSMRLLGDRRLDGRIKGHLSKHGCSFRTSMVLTSQLSGRVPTKKAIGLKRYLTFPEEISKVVETCLNELDVEVIDIDVLVRSLPSIHNVTYPPRNSFNAYAPQWGYWDSYSSIRQAEDQWLRTERWSSTPEVLLRWMPSLDRAGLYSCRYFLHDGHERLAEFSQSYAYLWTYLLDFQAHKPKCIWAVGNDIWLSSELPDAHWQLVMFLSDYSKRDGTYRNYHLEFAAKVIAERLHETLGVQVIETTPTAV